MPLNSFKVLLVDEIEQSRRASARHLQNAGYRVVEAATGSEALKLASKNPALIVLDVRLPDGSGFDVCAKIKADSATASIPILLTSPTFTQSEDRVRCLESGADGYLISPINPDELIASVGALLRSRKSENIENNPAVPGESICDAVSDGICIVGADGVITRCNLAFTKLLKQPFEQIVGRSFAELGESQFLKKLEALPVVKTCKKEAIETRLGSSWLLITADPIWSGTKELVGAVFIVTDITERKEAEIALAAVNKKIKTHSQEMQKEVSERTAELQRTIKSLDTFCYTIAHDLKSPLRSIKGFTTILREEYSQHFDDEGKDYTRRIVDSADRMNRLIDDLLDYGRLSNMDLPLQSISLEDEIQSVLNELGEDVLACEAEIEVRRPLPQVHANATMIKQVMSNLISNALKFVPAGKRPKVVISSEQNNGEVRITIQDNGIGIDPKCFKRIFDVFERLHGKDSGYPGTGIGLAIVRKGVERMGGAVGVESEQGQGSRFWVELPKAGK